MAMPPMGPGNMGMGAPPMGPPPGPGMPMTPGPGPAAPAAGSPAAAALAQRTADEELVEFCALAGQKFCDFFYFTCDQHRDQTLRFYRDQSVVVWNGEPVRSLPDFFKQLPATKHDVLTLDAQPIRLNDGSPHPSILVTTVGTVQYGPTDPQGFHHTFILDKDPQNPSINAYYVISTVFRNAKVYVPKSKRKG